MPRRSKPRRKSSPKRTSKRTSKRRSPPKRRYRGDRTYGQVTDPNDIETVNTAILLLQGLINGTPPSTPLPSARSSPPTASTASTASTVSTASPEQFAEVELDKLIARARAGNPTDDEVHRRTIQHISDLPLERLRTLANEVHKQRGHSPLKNDPSSISLSKIIGGELEKRGPDRPNGVETLLIEIGSVTDEPELEELLRNKPPQLLLALRRFSHLIPQIKITPVIDGILAQRKSNA